MYLIKGKKLLDAQVFNGRQKLLKLPLQTFFCGFLRVLFLFTHSYILGFKKHTLFNKFLSQKQQPIWQEKRVAGCEGWKGMIFCMLYLWHIWFIEYSIIHWIAWTHSKYMKWWSRRFNKGEILAPNRLSILSSYIEYSRVVSKKIIIKVDCC